MKQHSTVVTTVRKSDNMRSAPEAYPMVVQVKWHDVNQQPHRQELHTSNQPKIPLMRSRPTHPMVVQVNVA